MMRKKIAMGIMTLEKIGKLNEGFNPKDLLGQTIWVQTTPSGSKVQEKNNLILHNPMCSF